MNDRLHGLLEERVKEALKKEGNSYEAIEKLVATYGDAVIECLHTMDGGIRKLNY